MQSFFHLTPHNDIPAPDVSPHDCCADLSDAEHEAHLNAAMLLGDTLLAAIDAASNTAGEPFTYGVILEALRYVTWCVEEDLKVEQTDA